MDKATAGQELRSEVLRGCHFLLQFAASGSVFSYSPCFASLAPAAISAVASGVSVAANLINITPEGVNIQPQGLDIQPVGLCTCVSAGSQYILLHIQLALEGARVGVMFQARAMHLFRVCISFLVTQAHAVTPPP